MCVYTIGIRFMATTYEYMENKTPLHIFKFIDQANDWQPNKKQPNENDMTIAKWISIKIH